MDQKRITGFDTKGVIFTIVIGIIPLLSPQYAAAVFAQASETDPFPTANFNGVVTKVIDGDTLDIKTKDGKAIVIRLALVDAPETSEPGYTQAKDFVSQKCLNKAAEVDPDNNQDLTFGRLVAVVYCEGHNINEAIIANGFATIYQSFCGVSEFADTVWAQKFGCSNEGASGNSGTSVTDDEDDVGDCDASYASVCIPSAPPDLDCGEISHKNFKVLSPDPHGFDRDGDGIGCES